MDELEDVDTEESTVYNSLAKWDGRMCTVFDEIAKESEARGEARGRVVLEELHHAEPII